MNRNHIVKLNTDQRVNFEAFLDSFGDRKEEAILQDVFAARELAFLMLESNSLGKTLLEVGCGSGTKTPMLSEVFGLDVFSIDIQPGLGDRTLFMEDLPEFPIGSFDYIFANHVMEHVEEPSKAVVGLKSALSYSGIIGQAIPIEEDNHDASHLSVLTGDDWKRVYSEQGLSEISRRRFDYYGLPDWGDDFHGVFLFQVFGRSY